MLFDYMQNFENNLEPLNIAFSLTYFYNSLYNNLLDRHSRMLFTVNIQKSYKNFSLESN